MLFVNVTVIDWFFLSSQVIVIIVKMKTLSYFRR